MNTPDGGTVVPIMTPWELFYVIARIMEQCPACSVQYANGCTGQDRDPSDVDEKEINQRLHLCLTEGKKLADLKGCDLKEEWPKHGEN